MKRITCVKRMALAVIVSAALVGCSDQSVPYQNPTFGFLSKYARAKESTPVLLDNAAWWQGLHDKTLDHLVDLALRDSLSLEIARERVVAARAARDGVPGAVLLTSSIQAQVSGTEDGFDTDSTAGDLGLSWMLDPYGARRNELRAAGARIEVASAEVDAARLLLLFNMANTYARLRTNQQILVLNNRELVRRERTLALTRTLNKAEAATTLDVLRTRARVAEIRSELPGQRAAVAAALNEIAVLAGATPGTLPDDLMARLHQSTTQPRPTLTPDVGIPADLLRNRPDIHIAERQYYAAVADIGVARAALYPRLSLSGAISLNAVGRRTSGTEYFFGPLVQFPNLPIKQTRANVTARHAIAREAHARWKSTVLTAILEVQNALVAYRATSTALHSAREASQFYAQALSMTRVVFENGEATLTDLLNAEEAKAQADRRLIDLRAQHVLQFIELNVRLGAGNSVSKS